MKPIIFLRFLSLFGFLLLIAPFYDQCNGRGMRQAEATETIDSTAIVIEDESIKQASEINKVNDSIDIIDESENNSSICKKIYEFIDEEETQNAFELADYIKGYFDMTFAEFKDELVEDRKKNQYNTSSFLTRSISFILIVISSFLILILSFLRKINWIQLLTIINLISLLVATI